MSFCQVIKNELSEIKVSRCCMQALTYGLLLFGRAFSSKKISMQSENLSVTKLYALMVQRCYDASARITKGESKKVTYRAELIDEFDIINKLSLIGDIEQNLMRIEYIYSLANNYSSLGA